ncbi:MAG: hypothetical protein ABL958_09920 [Bdellovibrionia bacterium]
MEISKKQIGNAFQALRQMSPDATPDAESVKAIRGMLPKASKKSVENSLRLLLKVAHQSTKAGFTAFIKNGEVSALTLTDQEMELAKAGGNFYFDVFLHWVWEGTTVYAPTLPWNDPKIGYCY